MDSLRRLAVVVLAGAIAISQPVRVAISSDSTEAHKSLWTYVSRLSGVERQMPEVPTRIVSFDTTEGTFINIDVSPDGESLIFDLLGDLYQLPIEGGDAVPLTTGIAWDQAPRFSPDGAYVYFVSDRVGYKNLWQLTLADRSLRQITNLDRDIVGGPNWSKRASQLMVGIDTLTIPTGARSKVLHYIDPNSGAVTPINPPEGVHRDPKTRERLRNRTLTFSGVESTDGEVFYSELSAGAGHRGVRLYSFDHSTQTQTPLTQNDATYTEYKPQLSSNGSLLAYYRQYDDRHTELRVLNRRTGQDDRLIGLADADDAVYAGEDSRPNYAFTPDDQSIVFWHGGKIQRVAITDGSVKIIPFKVSVEREIVERVAPVQRTSGTDQNAIIRWPSLSSDEQTLVFAAIGYVWVMDMRSGDIRRLTDSDEFEYMPALSPDGQAVAYISFSQTGQEYGLGRLIVADLAGGSHRELLASPNADYLLPRWSTDGSKIAVIRQKGQLGGGTQDFGWIPAAKSSFNEVASASSVRVQHPNHALSIGFDATGDKLLFSYPESRTKTVLVTADLTGENVQTLAAGTPDVAGIVPAPDLKHLALTLRDDSVWVVPFRVEGDVSTVSSLASDAYRVSNNSGYFADWNDTEKLTFGFGTGVYKYRLKDQDLQYLGITVPLDTAAPIRSVAFTHARLITIAGSFGVGPVMENGAVVMRGNRIAAIGPTDEVAIPTDALVIDASGKTIVPGFLDTHYHRIGGNAAFGWPRSPMFDDKSALVFGVTSAWDPGTNVDVAPASADLQLAGRTAGPRWKFGAAVVNYPSTLFRSSGFLTNYVQALAVVESRRDLGATVLKEYNTSIRQEQQWFAAAARESGLSIVSHLKSFDGTMTRIIDGYTGGDHPRLPAPFYDDVQELLNQSGFVWTPNVVLTMASIGNHSDNILFYCDAVLQTANQSYREKLDAYSDCHRDQVRPGTDYEAHQISRIAEQVARVAKAGATIGVSAHDMPGVNLHREMWYLAKGGMPVEEVLRATTMNNAEKLGLQEDIGSLEVGKIADFLVLDENPLDDILNTLSLRYTVQGGVVYDSATAHRIDVSKIAETTSDSREVSLPRSDSQGVLLPVSP